MNVNTVEVIQEVARTLQGPAKHAIELYARWFFLSAVVWTILGFGFAVTGVVFTKIAIKREENSDDRALIITLCAAVIVLGVIIMFGNAPNLFVSEARAINEFLKNVSGGS